MVDFNAFRYLIKWATKWLSDIIILFMKSIYFFFSFKTRFEIDDWVGSKLDDEMSDEKRIMNNVWTVFL